MFVWFFFKKKSVDSVVSKLVTVSLHDDKRLSFEIKSGFKETVTSEQRVVASLVDLIARYIELINKHWWW